MYIVETDESYIQQKKRTHLKNKLVGHTYSRNRQAAYIVEKEDALKE